MQKIFGGGEVIGYITAFSFHVSVSDRLPFEDTHVR